MDWNAHQRGVEAALLNLLYTQTDTDCDEFYYDPEDDPPAHTLFFDHDADGETLYVNLKNRAGTESRRYRVRVLLEPRP